MGIDKYVCYNQFCCQQKIYYRVIKKGEQMKTIVLLRHGESTWNKDNRFTGWTDVDLTEKGIADAKDVYKRQV